MTDILGIGANTEVHAELRRIWEKGYREALLDMFVYLTGNPQTLQLDPDHLALINTMVAQVNDVGNRLLDVTDSDN